MKGTVKRWLGFRGYGFIGSTELDKDVFVHSSDIQGKTSLSEGEEVEFEVESSYKGPRAVKVKSVSEQDIEERALKKTTARRRVLPSIPLHIFLMQI